MRYAEIFEMAAPNAAIKSRIFYHGTSKETNAQEIIKNGLQPGNISGVARGHLTPVSGRTYLTDHIQYAQIYAIGGDIAGVELSDWVKRMIEKDGRYGYVFAIPGADIENDVQPDEDSVGQAVHHAYDIIEKDARGARFYTDALYVNLRKDPSFCKQLLSYAKASTGMTQGQFRSAIDGMISGQAAGGKRMLKNMPDWMKLKLIELGAHTAHQGGIIPREAWRIDKMKIPELHKDGSNFFNIAERIWVR
jgi:hypothetical protein